MKKSKLINGLKLLLITALIFFNSCSNEEYDGELNSNSNQVPQGIEITEDIAKEVALNFYSRTYKSRGELFRTENQTTTTTSSTDTIYGFDDQIGIYIVNLEPEGFVLVTSNSKNVPIAAHSETGTFVFDENSPDGLKSWITENIIFNDILETNEPIEEIDKQWFYLSEGRIPYPGDDDGVGESPSHTVRYSHTVNQQYGPLMTTIWGQLGPHNALIEDTPPTGCVATAMAQIMRYHEWPNTFNWSIEDENGIAASESYFKEFIIFDMSGRKVLAKNNADSVDINFLANGLYIIKAILNTNEIFTKKILK